MKDWTPAKILSLAFFEKVLAKTKAQEHKQNKTLSPVQVFRIISYYLQM